VVAKPGVAHCVQDETNVTEPDKFASTFRFLFFLQRARFFGGRRSIPALTMGVSG
jgi:hypothetical protein